MSEPIRIELPFVAENGSVNAYFCREPIPTLIDTGDASDAGWRALTAGLAEAGVVVGDLQRVIITHTHIDHFGQAARLCEASDAQFLTMDAGYGWLTDFTGQWQRRFDYYRDEFLPEVAMPEDARRIMLRYSQTILDTYRSVPAQRVTEFHDGDSIELGKHTWSALHTPGHASTLTCFHDAASRTLLSSDLVLARTPTPVVETPTAIATYGRPLPTHLKSLARVAALDIAMTLPGHGAPICDTASLIASQLRRIHSRKAECLGHVQAGVDTVFALTEAMYKTSAAPVNMAGLWMVVGYLDLLEEEGRVRRHKIDRCWRFEAIGP